MKTKLIAKCQNNSGNTFGNLMLTVRNHLNSEQGLSENLNSANSNNQRRKDLLMDLFLGTHNTMNLNLPEGLTLKEKDAVYDLEIAYNEALKDETNFYNSNFYKNRLNRVGVSSDNVSRLNNRMKNINHGYLSELYAAKEAARTNSPGSFYRAVTYTTNHTDHLGKIKKPGVYYNLGYNGNDKVGTWMHEMSHWADKGLTKDAKEHNLKLIEGNINPNLKGKELEYFGDPSEIRARAIPIQIHYQNNKNKFKSFSDYINRNLNNKSIRELRHTFKDDKSFMNYINNFVYNNSEPNDENIAYALEGIKLISKTQSNPETNDNYIAAGPLITATFNKPTQLTEFLQRDLDNAVKLGRISDNSVLGYQNWQQNFHLGNEDTKEFAERGADFAMGLASVAAGGTSAGKHITLAKSLGSAPAWLDQAQTDISNNNYSGIALDAINLATPVVMDKVFSKTFSYAPQVFLTAYEMTKPAKKTLDTVKKLVNLTEKVAN